MSVRVLVVDADPATRELHRMALAFVGYDVRAVDSGPPAEQAWAAQLPDVVVVSIRDEFAGRFIGRVRRSAEPVRCVAVGRAPIVGADVVVPFGGDLDALVGAVAGSPGVDTPIRVGALELDRRFGSAHIDGVELHLSPTEYRVLRLLALRAGNVVSKSTILDVVWRYDFGGRTNNVETYVSYLRRKLAPHRGPGIVTVRGAGYLLEE